MHSLCWQRWAWLCLIVLTMGCGGEKGDRMVAPPEDDASVESMPAADMPEDDFDSEGPAMMADDEGPEPLPAEPPAEMVEHRVENKIYQQNAVKVTSNDPAARIIDDRPQMMAVSPDEELRPTANVPSETDDVDAIVARLRTGNVVYNAPSKMTFGEPREIEVLLSPTQSANTLKQALRNQEEVQSSALRVGNRMEAKLTGGGFEIENLSEPLQAITSAEPTQWLFRVTPITHGSQQLQLRLLAHINVDGNPTPHQVVTKMAQIDVDITFGQRIESFVSNNWRWLWATLVVPVCGLAWRRKSTTTS